MATTKIWPVHDSLKRLVDYAGNPEKTEFNDLRQALHYAAAPDKTVSQERMFFVTGINCDADSVYEQMSAVKERFGKKDGNVAYHAYQSFKPGEVTPEQCHAIGQELARELWGSDYQVLVATHLDRNHLHNHFLVNSVSFRTGKKFNCNMGAYDQMRKTSDRLCQEHGLSVIKNPKGHTPRSLYLAEKNNEATKYNLMREAIDYALESCIDYDQLKRALPNIIVPIQPIQQEQEPQEKERRTQRQKSVTSYDQLPLALKADQVAAVLGISLAGAYNLMRSEGFPTLFIGKRMVVPRDRLIDWMNAQVAL